MTRQTGAHYDTPTRARVQGAYQYCIARAISFDSRAIFRTFNVKERSGYNMIRLGASARSGPATETRIRKRKATNDELTEAHNILQDEGLELKGKRYTWEALAIEVGADITGQTMQRSMQAAFNYHKCIACVKGWLADPQEAKRVEWATYMLNKYSHKKNWRRVQYSDEIHFGYELEGKLRITRQSGTRYRWDCIQHRDPSAEKDQKKLHC